MNKQELTELARRAIDGDSSAFASLYEEYREPLKRYIIKQGAGETDAEDVVSDAFAEALAHISDLREPAYFGTWLHRIARNAYLQQVRKNGRIVPIITEDCDDDSGRANDAVDIAARKDSVLNIADDTLILPEDYTENEELKQIMSETIFSMKEEFRDALFMFYYRNMTVADIAKAEGISEGTVKSRLHYAKKKLKEKLEPVAKSGGLFAAVPFSRLFELVDVSDSSGGAAVGTAAPGTAASASGGAVSSSAAAVSTVGSKITAGIIAAAVAGAVIVGFMAKGGDQDDKIKVFSETKNVSITDDSSAPEIAVTVTTAATTARSIQSGTSRTTSLSTDSTVRTNRTTRAAVSEQTVTTRREQQTAQPVRTENVTPRQTDIPQQTETTPQTETGPEIPEGPAVVDSGSAGANITWTLYDDGLLSFEGTGEMKQYGNQIYEWRLAGSNTEIKKIYISDGVTSISGLSFGYNPSLSEVTIPESVTHIGPQAFESSPSLESISISNVTQIQEGTFSDCTKLKSVVLSDRLETIGPRAFSSCGNLKLDKLPESVTSIGDNAFGGCSNVSLTIPRNVKTLGRGAFYGCGKISIDPENPYFCIDNGLLLTKNKGTVLGLAGAIDRIEFPEGVRKIDDHAFDYYEISQEEIVIPDGVLSIGERSFFGIKLNSITIPASVAYIGENAFYNNNDRSILIKCPKGSYAENWAKKNNIEYEYI